MTKVQRYKVGYYTDEWGMSSNTPCIVPDDSGYAVKFEDYCKLEAENAALKERVVTLEKLQGVALIESLRAEVERLNAELAKYRDAYVVAWVEVIDSYEGPYHFHGQKLLGVGKHKLIVKPGEEK